MRFCGVGVAVALSVTLGAVGAGVTDGAVVVGAATGGDATGAAGGGSAGGGATGVVVAACSCLQRSICTNTATARCDDGPVSRNRW